MSDYNEITLNDELVEKLAGKSFNEDLGLGLFRYINLRDNGSFHSCISYLKQTAKDGKGFRILGSIYGYEGGGVYSDGVFRVVSDEDYSCDYFDGGSFEDPEEDTDFSSADIALLNALIGVNSKLWDYSEEDEPDLIPQLTEMGQDLMDNSDDEDVFMDPGFDGDELEDVSQEWPQTLHF